ncbi:pollen receptor-like kinase 4 [Curcuma longa]|uniref:pollen receptor-like kinase 4 n=1 Tax=Curcuma longa TaxID=136217 RepID=UPI003D9E1169
MLEVHRRLVATSELPTSSDWRPPKTEDSEVSVVAAACGQSPAQGDGLTAQDRASRAGFPTSTPSSPPTRRRRRHCRRRPGSSDVFCLGIVLLELLTGKFPSQYLGDGAKAGGGGGTDVVHWATYAVGEGREADILDPAIVAGPHAAAWVPEMKRLVRVGVDCSAAEPERRIELREAVARIEEVAAGVRDGAGERPS